MHESEATSLVFRGSGGRPRPATGPVLSDSVLDRHARGAHCRFDAPYSPAGFVHIATAVRRSASAPATPAVAIRSLPAEAAPPAGLIDDLCALVDGSFPVRPLRLPVVRSLSALESTSRVSYPTPPFLSPSSHSPPPVARADQVPVEAYHVIVSRAASPDLSYSDSGESTPASSPVSPNELCLCARMTPPHTSLLCSAAATPSVACEAQGSPPRPRALTHPSHLWLRPPEHVGRKTTLSELLEVPRARAAWPDIRLSPVARAGTSRTGDDTPRTGDRTPRARPRTGCVA